MKIYNNIKKIPRPHTSGDIIGKPYLLPLQLTQEESSNTSFHFLKEGSTRCLLSCKGLTKVCSGVFLFPGLFSYQQMDEVKERVIDLNFTSDDKTSKKSLVVYDKDFARTIWDSISDSLLREIVDVKDCDISNDDLVQNTNQLDGIHEAFTLVHDNGKANDSESTIIQRDATFVKDRSNRSLFSIVISLNSDNVKGGGIVFHLPKDASTEIPKGSTIKNEITHHGNLYCDFEHFVPSFKRGDVLVFKQDVLYQYLPIIGDNIDRYILKGNIMLHSENKLERELSKLDNRTCAEHFCKAEKLVSDQDFMGARECLEKVLSIRRSPETPVNSQTWSPIRAAEIEKPAEPKNTKRPSNNPFSIFSIEIWYKIIHFVNDYESIGNLCKVFDELSQIRKELFFRSFFKDTFSTSHHVQFKSDNAEFIANNQSRFAKAAAVYTIFLIGDSTGTKKDHNSYLLAMDKDNGNLNEVRLNDLLFGILEEGDELLDGSCSTVFKVRQQKGSKKNYRNDLFHSVDRRFMTTHYNCDDIGIDIESEICSTVTVPSKGTKPEEKKNLDVFFPQTNSSSAAVEHRNVMTLTTWDRFFEFWKGHYVAWKQMKDNSSVFYDMPPNSKYKDDKDLFMKSLYNGSGDTLQQKNALLIPCSDIENGPLPGALVVRKLNQSVEVERGSCLCLHGVNVLPNLSKNSSTLSYNHLIMDFGRVEMKLEEVEDITVNMGDSFIEKLIVRLGGLLSNNFTVVKFTVDFLHKSDENGYKQNSHYLENKRGGCQCTLPAFRVENFVGVTSRFTVKRVLVIIARSKRYINQCFVFTSFDDNDVQYATRSDDVQKEATPSNTLLY